MNVKKIKNKTFCWKKVIVCSKGLKGAPLKTLTLFFPQTVFFFIFFFEYLWKVHLVPIQDFFHKNMHVIKKKEFLTARSSNWSVPAKFFPMLVEKPFIGGVINPKTYKNHERGFKFFPEWFGIEIREPIFFFFIM